MAFVNKNLAVLAYANGFTLWHYTTSDADVETANYFDEAANTLRVGDMVLVNSNTAVTPTASILAVASNSEGEVTVANLVPAEQGGGE